MEAATWPPRPSIGKPIVILFVAGLAWFVREVCRFGCGPLREDLARAMALEDSAVMSTIGMLHRTPCEAPTELRAPFELERDPWGTPYRFFCNAHGITGVSAGEDGAFFTDDDIRSDR